MVQLYKIDAVWDLQERKIRMAFPDIRKGLSQDVGRGHAVRVKDLSVMRPVEPAFDAVPGEGGLFVINAIRRDIVPGGKVSL